MSASARAKRRVLISAEQVGKSSTSKADLIKILSELMVAKERAVVEKDSCDKFQYVWVVVTLSPGGRWFPWPMAGHRLSGEESSPERSAVFGQMSR